jgi:hypothetical protein
MCCACENAHVIKTERAGMIIVKQKQQNKESTEELKTQLIARSDKIRGCRKEEKKLARNNQTCAHVHVRAPQSLAEGGGARISYSVVGQFQLLKACVVPAEMPIQVGKNGEGCLIAKHSKLRANQQGNRVIRHVQQQ